MHRLMLAMHAQRVQQRDRKERQQQEAGNNGSGASASKHGAQKSVNGAAKEKANGADGEAVDSKQYADSKQAQ